MYVDFFDAGLTDLIPIRKGDKRPTGKWTEVRAGRTDVKGWQDGNLGLRTANFPCVDIDVQDAPLAEALHDLAERVIGPAPCRTGLPPKRAIVYRLGGGVFPKRWIQFERNGVSYRVEILAGGQYVVIGGTHPSGATYTWDGFPRAAELPELSEELADEYLAEAVKLVEAAGWTVVTQKTQATQESAPDQQILVGTVEEVTRLVKATPNEISSRDDYLRMGFAIKAALPHAPGEALELWLDWCERWTGGTNDQATSLRDWQGMHGPYRVGVDFLRLQARALGGLSTAQDVFEPLEDVVTRDQLLHPYTDAWLAARFIGRHKGEYRFCEETGKWLRWDGTKWEQGSNADAQHATSLLAQEASLGATTKEQLRWCLSLNAVRAGATYAALDPEIRVSLSDLDKDPWVLNTPGGVVDLRTGAMLPPNPSLLLTRTTLVTPHRMPTPKWDAFLKQTTGDDPALAAYLQRLAGYALTGVTNEQTFAFVWGPGGNGKGVFLNTITKALGTYATIAPMGTFVSSQGERHPTDLASLAGARLVTAQETEEGRSWDEAKVKSITGGDPISARFMGKDFFTFQPQFKLIFAGNHKPHTKNLDPAMRRRLHLVPFTQRPVEVNTFLQDELVEELPGILAWALDGCLAWQSQGLNPPTAVLEETENYFNEEDLLGRWSEERTVFSQGITAAADLYNDWCRWCMSVGEPHGSMKAFSAALRGRGLQSVRTKKARGFNLALVSEGPPSTTLGGPISLEALDDDPLPMIN
jgi:P4 family phage/plasmid primase-like protien